MNDHLNFTKYINQSTEIKNCTDCLFDILTQASTIQVNDFDAAELRRKFYI